MTDFNAWSHENLVKFAQDATAELQFLRDALAYVTADTAPDADVTVQTPTGPVAMKVTTLPFVP